MALQIASDLVPSGGGTFYLLEDLYLKGGFSVRDNVAARDAIALSNLKKGQLVLTADNSKIWICKDLVVATPEAPDVEEKATWEEFLTNGGAGGGLGDDAPEDGKVYGRKDGEWVIVAGAGGAVPLQPNSRVTAIHNVETLAVSGSAEFVFEMAVSCIMLKLTVSRPVKLTAYSTPAMDDVNPYQFLATDDHLTDDGSMLLADGTVFRSRNFSILANMEETPTNNIYWTVDGVDESEGPVTITALYLPLEVIETEEEEEPVEEPTTPPSNP